MSDNLYQPFLEATRNVFELMLDITDILDQLLDGFECEDELLVSIEVIGDLTGEVIYHFPRDTSLKMVNVMSGMEISSVDDFVTSAISEIANIISGNVLTILSEGNLICDILPPALGKMEDDKEYAIRRSYCLSTELGDVCLEVKLNPNKEA